LAAIDIRAVQDFVSELPEQVKMMVIEDSLLFHATYANRMRSDTMDHLLGLLPWVRIDMRTTILIGRG